MKNKLSILLVLGLLALSLAVNGQDIKNFRAVQEGNQVKISYDLSGAKKMYNISLYYTLDKGKTWLGPMLKISGDAGGSQSPGTNKLIIWDALSEQGPLDGMVQFKLETEIMPEPVAEKVKEAKPPKEAPIRETTEADRRKAETARKEPEKRVEKPVAEKTIAAVKPSEKAVSQPWLNDETFKKTRTSKIVFLGSAIATSGLGFFAFSQGNSLYSEYEAGSSDAASLRKKIETFDMITPLAFGLAGICGAGFILKTVKAGNIRKQLSIHAYPDRTGSGVSLTYTF